MPASRRPQSPPEAGAQEPPPAPSAVPHTPDGRYIVVRGRLWRAANPGLSPQERTEQVAALMAGRRGVAAARRSGDAVALRHARAAVDAAKHKLGERGPVWWDDGAPDLNRHMVRTTPYAEWYAQTLASLDALPNA